MSDVLHIFSNMIIYYKTDVALLTLVNTILMRLFTININYDALVALLTLINTILTLLIGYVFSRPAFVRWRKDLYYSFIYIWGFFIGVYLIKVFNSEIPILLLVLFLIIFLCVVCCVGRIFYYVLNLELIQFNNLDIPQKFDHVDSGFGSECIDKAIEDAKAEKTELILYPLIIAADESWRPWNIAQKFVVNTILANKKETGIVYFTFNRAHHHIIEGLKCKAKAISKSQSLETDFFKNLVIIDCFSFLSMKEKKQNAIDHLEQYEYFIDDPRNPHVVNKCYETAISHLYKKSCRKICVVYDALSDFLCFTDEQIVIQYLRHNMFLEEKFNISSVYIYRLNTVQNIFFDQYLIWFTNCILYFEYKNNKPRMRTCGLFSDPRCYSIDCNLCLK